MTDEVWKPIPGYGGHYEASSLGNIRVKDRIIRKWHRSGKFCEQRYKGRLLRPAKCDKWGHMSVTLGVDGIDYSRRVHTLVLTAFVGPCPAGMEGCHNNGVANENRIENLRWDTHAANNADRKKHGTYSLGADHPMATITNEVAALIAADSRPTKEICQHFGVNKKMVYNIKSGKTWGHLGVKIAPCIGKRDEDVLRGQNHPRAKLTEQDVLAIRADTRTQERIGQDYGLTQSSVQSIKARRTWMHVA